MTIRIDSHLGSQTPPAATRRWAIALHAIAACLAGVGFAQAQTVRGDFSITNGTVNVQALSASTLYIGGSFSRVGPTTGSAIPVDAATGTAEFGFARVVGEVDAVVPDGAGGWFIGGAFTSVGGEPRAGLAHLLADHSVSAWDPSPNGTVRALFLSGDTLFVGGDFTSVGGDARNRIAALDTTNGLATAWDPNANGSVRALTVAGGVVYAGGSFTSIGGESRNRIAAIDARTGLAASFNPNANGLVLALTSRGDTLFAGGSFTTIGGASRSRIAALEVATGLATSWNPNANNQVLALATSGDTLYAGGLFTNIGGAGRNRIAALELATGLATTWNPNASATVRTLAVRTDTVYAGGDFVSIGAQARNQIAALDAATGLATAWDPSAYGVVLTVAADNGTVFAGGVFNGMGGFVRHNLAALDVTTGVATAWDPNADQPILALASSGDTVYAAGNFTQIGGASRNRIAALDASTGLAMDWNPNANSEVASLAVSAGRVYAGGSFTDIGGETRNWIAALDATTGLATAWNPNANQQVLVIAANGGTVYVGGDFTTIGGQARNRIAALDPATGLATAWNPNANGTVRALATACGITYAGGFFTTIGGQTRSRIAALDAATGLATGWNPDANGPLFGLALGEGTVYASGVLNFIGGQNRNRIASLDAGTGLATSWNPSSNGTVRNVVADGGAVYAGGSFSAMGAAQAANLAAIEADHSIACPTLAFAPDSLPSGAASSPYAATLSVSGGTAPFCLVLAAGNLPAGISLSVGGEVSGTPTAAGTALFTIAVTDAHGCRGTKDYVLNVFEAPSGFEVAANTAGLCLSPSNPCVKVPVVLSRAEAAPLRAISVTVAIDTTRLSLCTPSEPESSIRVGSWLGTFSSSTFEVADNGDGSYTVDAEILDEPCGETSGGELFTVDLQSAFSGDETGAVAVTSAHVRDCSDVLLSVTPGPAASLEINNAAPPPIADLAAESQTTGNPPGATTGIQLNWTASEGGTVRLYRAPFGTYPEYDDLGEVSPPDPQAVPGPPWELVDTSATSGHLDVSAPRGFWYYVAILTDSCGSTSAVSNMTEGTLNYHLGDVSSVPGGPGTGDNRVDGLDVSLLGLHYGIEEPEISTAGVAYLDVGPTTDLQLGSRPSTDNRIDFEDLMVFAGNYQVVSAPQSVVSADPVGSEDLRVTAPSLVEPGTVAIATLHLRAAGRLHGFSAELAWDPAVVVPFETHSGRFVESQQGMMLAPRPGTVDAALLGVRARGMTGEGDVATVSFRALQAGDPAIRLARVVARDAANRPLALDPNAPTASASLPAHTALLAPRPNPFAGEATIVFTLSKPGAVELAVYSVDGRQVRRLMSGPREAAVHRVTWDGRDEGGRAVSSGLYYLRLLAGGREFTTRLVCVR